MYVYYDVMHMHKCLKHFFILPMQRFINNKECYICYFLFSDRHKPVMIMDHDPIVQALFASLFTWGVTALGAALVFVLPSNSKKFLGECFFG